MYNENMIEEELQTKKLTAPRLSPEKINEVIVGETFYVFPGTTKTVCCLLLRNGFTVIGESAAVSLDNFDQEIGQKIAREDARRKVWVLEGYLLKEKFFVA